MRRKLAKLLRHWAYLLDRPPLKPRKRRAKRHPMPAEMPLFNGQAATGSYTDESGAYVGSPQ